jgi:hypothetical protein
VTLIFWAAYAIGAGIAGLTIFSLLWLMRDPKEV